MYGDGSELCVLERLGIERANLVVAVTGDDEDNILIRRSRARSTELPAWSRAATTRATSSTSSLLGAAGDLGHRPDPAPDRARGAEYGLVHLLDLPEERLEITEFEVGDGSPAGPRGEGPRAPDGLARHLHPPRGR